MPEDCKSCERLAAAETEVTGLREDIQRMLVMQETMRADIAALRVEYATAKGGLLMARWLWGAGGAALAVLGVKVMGAH